MGAPSVNLKTVVEADTSKFSASMKQVKSDMKDLDKVSSNALDSLGKAIGVDVGKLQQMTGALSGLGREFSQMGDEGSKAMGSILQSIAPVAGAIAGLGLAGAALAFKALTSEAEAFKRTVEGANMEMATAAYIETYRQAFHDMNTDAGRAAAQAESSWKKFWGTLGTNIKLAFTSGALGGALELPPMDIPNINGVDEMGKSMADFNAKATRATEISNELYQLHRQINQKLTENAHLDAEIAQLRADAIDPEKTAAQHAEALALAKEKVRQKYEGPNGLIALQQRVAELTKENEDLVGDDAAAQEKINAELAKADGYVAAKNNELKAITKAQNTINKELEKEVTLRKSIDQLAPVTRDIAGPQAYVQTTVGLAVDQESVEYYREVISASLGDTTVYIGFKADTERLKDITREVESVVSNLATSTGEAIGQLIGDLTTGGDAWGNFANTALSALGDLAVSVGKMAVATGVATLGIKAALESLDGYVAIAAGVALIALGTAVKAGLSNIASGNYTAAPAVASGNYSSSNNDYETREVNVKVTGTLEADGDQLVAVINSANNKNYYTT